MSMTAVGSKRFYAESDSCMTEISPGKEQLKAYITQEGGLYTLIQQEGKTYRLIPEQGKQASINSLFTTTMREKGVEQKLPSDELGNSVVLHTIDKERSYLVIKTPTGASFCMTAVSEQEMMSRKEGTLSWNLVGKSVTLQRKEEGGYFATVKTPGKPDSIIAQHDIEGVMDDFFQNELTMDFVRANSHITLNPCSDGSYKLVVFPNCDGGFPFIAILTNPKTWKAVLIVAKAALRLIALFG